MRILVLSHTSDLVGGAERSMLDVFDDWAAHYKIEPIFILREPLGTLVEELNRRGWLYHPLKYTFWSWPNPPTNPADINHHLYENKAAIASIEKLIKNLEPDVVMTNTVICPWAALAAYIADVPHVWFVREYGDLDHDRRFDMSQKPTFEDVGSLSALVVANSKTLASHIEQYVPKSKVAILYIPFKIKQLVARSKLKTKNPFKTKGLKVIMTSNISRTKGQLAAVEAVGKLHQQGYDIQLCIVGKNVDKNYYQEIEEAIKRFDIADKVIFLGLQPNVPALVALADVGIVASQKEAFGRTTYEYLVLGRAVVGANSGATPEMVKNAKNGYLFNPGDAETLASGLRHYLDNPRLLHEHGRYSRMLAKEMMSGPFNSAALYKKIETVVAHKNTKAGAKIHYFDHMAKLEREQVAITRSLRWRMRQLAKTNYYRLKKIRAWLKAK